MENGTKMLLSDVSDGRTTLQSTNLSKSGIWQTCRIYVLRIPVDSRNLMSHAISFHDMYLFQKASRTADHFHVKSFVLKWGAVLAMKQSDVELNDDSLIKMFLTPSH